MRRARLLAPLACLALAACYTQADIDRPPPPQPLSFRLLPYPTYDGDEGLVGNLDVAWRKPGNRRPPPVSLGFGGNVRFATSGTRGILLNFDAPGYWKNWRLLGIAGAERLQRVPFYGIGNTAPIVDTLPSEFYRYALNRTTLLGVVQRRITRRVRLHAGVQWRHYKASSLGDSTLFAEQVAAGVPLDTLGVSIVTASGGLLFDTRDQEASPTRGVFFEGMVAHAVSGADFTRYLISGREFIPLGDLDQWVIGLRQTAELSSDQPMPLFVANERLTTWYPEDGFGGPTSLRLYSIGRFVAPNRSVVSADLRYKVLDAPLPTSPIRVWALGFVDVGRLWDQGADPSLTDLHWSTGVGGRLQFGKGTLLGLDIGRTDEGFGFTIGTSFAF